MSRINPTFYTVTHLFNIRCNIVLQSTPRNTKKYHVFAPMGRFQLESIYLYFPQSSQLLYYYYIILLLYYIIIIILYILYYIIIIILYYYYYIILYNSWDDGGK